jgi:hypothetical protein
MIRFDHIVLHVTPDSMLRPKQGCQVYFRMLVEQIGGVAKSMIDRSLITNEANARVSQDARFLVEQSFEAEFDWMMAVVTHYLSAWLTAQH